MPRELYDKDGNAVEVPDDDEVKSLREQAEAKTKLEKELEEAKAAADPDWAKTRSIIKGQEREIARLRKLEEQGKTVNDKGEVVDFKPSFSAQEIEERANVAGRRAAVGQMVDERKEEYLGGLDDEKRKVVLHLFDKFSAGEEMTPRKVDEYMGMAMRAMDIRHDSPASRAAAASGRSMKPDGRPEESFADTERGKTLAGNIGLTFTQEKK